MHFITSPTVHVLSTPSFIPHPEYTIPNGGTPSEKLIAHAGKGCYDSYGSDGRSIQDHISNLIGTRHGSVLEHANISVFITGISRGCSHEIVRHRPGFAYSQRSTRYTREDDASFVMEPFYAMLENQQKAGALDDMDQLAILNLFKRHCEESLARYRDSVAWLMAEAPHYKLNGVEQRKWARGKARQLLPHALETRMTMTGNLRAWRFFLEERSSPFAEPEIRRLAMHIMNAIHQYAPLVFNDMASINTPIVDDIPHYKPEVSKV